MNEQTTREDGLACGIATRAGASGDAEGACALCDYTSRASRGYLCFMAVADGFGGAGRGDVASRLAVDTLQDSLDPNHFENQEEFRGAVKERLLDAMSSTNRNIIETGKSHERTGLGTTITCAVTDSENAFIAHAGNARACLLTSRGLRQITSDHVEPVGERKKRLTRALGVTPEVEPDVLRVPLLPGETLFICSHGLYSALSVEELACALSKATDLQNTCEGLVDTAFARGATSDASLVAWRVPGARESDTGAVERSATAVKVPAKKRRRFVVAFIVFLAIAACVGAGWGAREMWFKNKTAGNKAANSAPERSSIARFKQGDSALVNSMGRPDACYLMDYPGGEKQTKLYDDWNVNVLSTRYAKGEQWCRVEVVGGVPPATGKRGYVQESFLVRATQP
ncbi:MAG: hypothetical protein CVT63_07010 [Candidatus Anoxymicrobium japonicum]|uniref:PPM-type phosphatase domain-containing protein n=1 Tax=Candidatus Anoxymicrobium japonicum TaxID=2013648 RepID=A0A2N3G4G1_9ACTN|nr:MAG: hypothetical protein CVT63_07010 [Candidatus Anoxymicrobium japonicum]